MELTCPDDFRCPISLELMTDPVILTSGHTFDRSSIQRWLDRGNRTCPVTNLPLPRHPSLIPNHALRRLISEFAPAATTNDKSSSPDISVRYPSDTETLSSLLRSIKESPDFRREIADSDTPLVLMRHVSSGDHHPELQKLAIDCILYLSLESDDVKVGLVMEGAVDHLISAVKSRSDSSSTAATVITSLAIVDVNKVSIGNHPAAISTLSMLLEPSNTLRERKEAATALYELSRFPPNRKRVVRTGAVRALARLAGEGSDRAAEVLALLARTREGREEMGRIEGFVRVMAGVARSGSRRGAESARAVLQLLAGEDEGKPAR